MDQQDRIHNHKLTPLTTDEAAELLGLKSQTLHNWRHLRKGPRYHKLGRRIIYLLDDLEAFMESCAVNLEG